MSDFLHSYRQATQAGDQAKAAYFWELAQVEERKKRDAEQQLALGKKQTELLAQQTRSMESQARAAEGQLRLMERQTDELMAAQREAAEAAAAAEEAEAARRDAADVEQMCLDIAQSRSNRLKKCVVRVMGKRALDHFVFAARSNQTFPDDTDQTVHMDHLDHTDPLCPRERAGWITGMLDREASVFRAITDEKARVAALIKAWETECKNRVARAKKSQWIETRTKVIQRSMLLKRQEESAIQLGIPLSELIAHEEDLSLSARNEAAAAHGGKKALTPWEDQNYGVIVLAFLAALFSLYFGMIFFAVSMAAAIAFTHHRCKTRFRVLAAIERRAVVYAVHQVKEDLLCPFVDEARAEAEQLWETRPKDKVVYPPAVLNPPLETKANTET